MTKILIACEESQIVCTAFREKGFEAYSCDILDCSGGHPEWHFKCDVLDILNGGRYPTSDGIEHDIESWDLMIAHPPCTHLAVSGARWFKEKQEEQKEALEFVARLLNAPIHKIALENPIGIISSKLRKPDQIIQPYLFGDEAQKTTCLWLKNLPQLQPTKIVGKGEFVTFKSGKKHPKWYAEAFKLSKEERAKIRSKTFPGIANAMAEQWGNFIKENGLKK